MGSNKGDSGETGSTFRLLPKPATEGSLSKGAVVNKKKEKIDHSSAYGSKAATSNKKGDTGEYPFPWPSNQKGPKGDYGERTVETSSKGALVNKNKASKKGDSGSTFLLQPKPTIDGPLSKGATGYKNM